MSSASLAAKVAAATPTATPPSFNGDETLFAFNLFAMTALLFLGVMMAGKQARRIWQQRHIDHPKDPVTLHRLILLCAAIALGTRSCADAMLMWGWSPTDPDLTARVVMAKRWLDPIGLSFAVMWMTIAVLGEPGIEHQLRKAPLPVDMWSRWPALMRAGAVVILSFIAAFAAVVLR